jgi:hypothetical protein
VSALTFAAANPAPTGATHTSRLGVFDRHRPEETVLFKTLQEHWKSFVAEIEASADLPALPAFVVSEVEAFLRCGILAHGLVLTRCRDCGWSRAVAFSCKRRAFCTSCIGRRMCDFAARLITQVLPCVPVRQWVLTVPHDLRVKLAIDPALTTRVLAEFIASVSAWLRRRARRLGLRGALKTGAVTVIQRFNSALDVSPHFHTLFMDGVYSFPVGGKPVFHPLPAPRDEEVAEVAAEVFRRVEGKLRADDSDDSQQRLIEEAPLLAALTEASCRGIIATGPRRGCRVVRVRGLAADVDACVMGRLCAQVEGYNLQAATRIAANDRNGLERMGRYLARPPVATDRLSRLDDGRLELSLKRPWRDGTIAFRYTPHELIERLIAIVPRPRAHLIRYSGVLAPAFAARSEIVPGASEESPGPAPAPLGAEVPRQPGRFSWASLIWRVFLEDVLACARCPGRMAIVAVVTSKVATTRILNHLGLPTVAPACHAARPPPQIELPLDAAPAFESDPPGPDDHFD